MLISLIEYATKHGKNRDTVRQMAARGSFGTAQKIGRNWVIDSEEPYPDHRITTGKYVDEKRGRVMKNYGEIRVVQSTALGNDDTGKTKLYVLSNVRSSNNDVMIATLEQARCLGSPPDMHWVGYVTIVHPVVMWGDHAENVQTYIDMAIKKLLDDGVIQSNDFGVCFLTKKEVDSMGD